MNAEGIAVWVDSRDERTAAGIDSLVKRLGGHLTETAPAHAPYLRVDGDGLALVDPAGAPPSTFRVDFLRGRQGWRLRQARHHREALGRACAIGRRADCAILDATAGTGADSALLAILGGRVTAVERHPLVAALLLDGWRRACLDPRLGPALRRMAVHDAEAVTWMAAHPGAYDVIYLDPMFESTGSAAAAKPMAMLRRLIPPSSDATAVLEEALGHARQRVVVKRHRGAAPLGGIGSDFRIGGRTIRFDVYVTSDSG